MMHKVLNGFTVVAHNSLPTGGYMFLASRRTGPGTYEYVVSYVQNIDLDTSWSQGNYFTDFARAAARYAREAGI